MTLRTDRLGSLLRQVINEVLRDDVRHPDMHEFVTVTRVEVSRDVRHARVYVSIMQEREKTLKALESAAGFIAKTASKKVTLRYFPELVFKLDDTVDKQEEIARAIEEVQQERDERDTFD